MSHISCRGEASSVSEVAMITGLYNLEVSLTKPIIKTGANTFSNLEVVTDDVLVSQLADGIAGQLITWAVGGAPTVVLSGKPDQILTMGGSLPAWKDLVTYWSRTETILSPLNTGDSINIGSGKLLVNSSVWLERADTNNQFIGVETSPAFLSGAQYNLCVGIGAGVAIINGDSNSIFGYTAGDSITSGSNNTIMGYNAGGLLAEGAANVFIGANCAKTIASTNTAVVIGNAAAQLKVGVAECVIIGASAVANGASSITNGVIIGFQAGYSLTTGANNVLIGHGVGFNLTTGASNVFIGYNAGYNLTTESNRLYIENSSSGAPLIYGEFDNDLLTFNADVTIPDGKKLRVGTGLDGQIYASSDNLYIENITSDLDIYFRGNDGGVATNIMILDVSAGQLSGMQKAVAGVMTNAVAGTDYAVATAGTVILKGDGTGGFAEAIAGTDYYSPGGPNVVVADGGTNLSAYTTGDLIYASLATTLARLVDVAAGQPLLSGGVLAAPAYAGYTLSGTAAQTYTFPSADATLASLAGIETLTNKRITQRVATVASSATPTPAGDTTDLYTITALAEAATFGAPTGTPTEGQKLMIRIKDNGTARVLGWNVIYRASSDLALPTTTILSKTMYVGFVYNNTDSKFDLVSLLDNF